MNPSLTRKQSFVGAAWILCGLALSANQVFWGLYLGFSGNYPYADIVFVMIWTIALPVLIVFVGRELRRGVQWVRTASLALALVFLAIGMESAYAGIRYVFGQGELAAFVQVAVSLVYLPVGFLGVMYWLSTRSNAGSEKHTEEENSPQPASLNQNDVRSTAFRQDQSLPAKRPLLGAIWMLGGVALFAAEIVGQVVYGLVIESLGPLRSGLGRDGMDIAFDLVRDFAVPVLLVAVGWGLRSGFNWARPTSLALAAVLFAWGIHSAYVEIRYNIVPDLTTTFSFLTESMRSASILSDYEGALRLAYLIVGLGTALDWWFRRSREEELLEEFEADDVISSELDSELPQQSLDEER
ncbi:MAG: hypothetical protein O2854_04450 [Chloroflexi bacterium]|nr:hypothetical protein [Chloroflexota bacterium]